MIGVAPPQRGRQIIQVFREVLRYAIGRTDIHTDTPIAIVRSASRGRVTNGRRWAESVGRSDERVRRAGPSMTHVPHQGAATTTTTTEKLMRGELSAERHAVAVASFVLFSGDSASASLDASASRAGGPYNASRSYCIPPPMAASVGNNGNLPPSFLSKLLIPLQLTNICGKTSRNALCKWKADAKSQNLCSKLEPEVVYSRRLLDSEREKSRKRIL